MPATVPWGLGARRRRSDFWVVGEGAGFSGNAVRASRGCGEDSSVEILVRAAAPRAPRDARQPRASEHSSERRDDEDDREQNQLGREWSTDRAGGMKPGAASD